MMWSPSVETSTIPAHAVRRGWLRQRDRWEAEEEALDAWIVGGVKHECALTLDLTIEDL